MTKVTYFTELVIIRLKKTSNLQLSKDLTINYVLKVKKRT